MDEAFGIRGMVDHYGLTGAITIVFVVASVYGGIQLLGWCKTLQGENSALQSSLRRNTVSLMNLAEARREMVAAQQEMAASLREMANRMAAVEQFIRDATRRGLSS